MRIVMAADIEAGRLPEAVECCLTRSPDRPQQVVVMACGISGAGKSTLSKVIRAKHPNFERISIDAELHQTHGLYNIDFAPELYEQYQIEASTACDARLLSLLKDGTKDILLDQSFYNRAWRNEVKQLAESYRARWVLLYLKATKDTLWRRIQERKAGERNADAAFDVTEKVFERYWHGFEAPENEGEIVIEVM